MQIFTEVIRATISGLAQTLDGRLRLADHGARSAHAMNHSSLMVPRSGTRPIPPRHRAYSASGEEATPTYCYHDQAAWIAPHRERSRLGQREPSFSPRRFAARLDACELSDAFDSASPDLRFRLHAIAGELAQPLLLCAMSDSRRLGVAAIASAAPMSEQQSVRQVTASKSRHLLGVP